LQIKTKIVGSHTAYSKPVKQEVNSTVILPPLVFPDRGFKSCHWQWKRQNDDAQTVDKMASWLNDAALFESDVGRRNS
jgi:hypothetical protein